MATAAGNGSGVERSGGFPAWVIAFGATLGASAATALVVGWAAVHATAASLEDRLTDALRRESSLVAAAVGPLDLDGLGGPSSTREEVERRLADLEEASGLRAVALLGPREAELGSGRGWRAREADAESIAAAAAGTPAPGSRYRDPDGGVVRTSYAPVPGHPGWVAAVEAPDAPEVDLLARALGLATGSALVVATGVAAVAAAGTTRSLRRLDDDLARATPSTAGSIGVHGSREVRNVARTARDLLSTIHLRDLALRDLHDAQVRQLEALAAAVAHEVRNPLHALGMTLDRVAGSDAARRDTLLKRAGERLTEIQTILERFLSLSRPIEPHPVPLDPLGVLRDVAAEAPELQLVAPDIGRMVLADPALLRQVLRNLLRNAREAGARAVTVTVADSAPLALDLEDDGSGLAPGIDPFEWFATTRAEGTGLGLPWSRRVARAMGGDLALLTSKPACFRLLLPRSPE